MLRRLGRLGRLRGRRRLGMLRRLRMKEEEGRRGEIRD
jgi:hypothetical protein